MPTIDKKARLAIPIPATQISDQTENHFIMSNESIHQKYIMILDIMH